MIGKTTRSPIFGRPFGEELTDDHRFQPGHAPAGWTSLVDHLRRRGVTDEEMLITGVTVIASTGRLIDRLDELRTVGANELGKPGFPRNGRDGGTVDLGR